MRRRDLNDFGDSNEPSGTILLKDAGKIVGSLYRTSKYLTPRATRYHYKSQIRHKIEYYSHIWHMTVIFSIESKNVSCPYVWWVIPPPKPLPHRQNVASLSLLYRYSYGKCSDELYCLVPPVLILTVKTCNATRIVAKHPYTCPYSVGDK